MSSAATTRASGPARRPVPLTIAAVTLVAVAAALAWSGSLSAPFAMDDQPSILANASIRRLWPPGWMHPPATIGETVGGRPVLNFTFALNHAAGGSDVRGYRLANVFIHALAALTLFGLVRRTVGLESATAGRDRPVPPCGRNAGLFALVVALLWFLHPLQTESVTYVVQRAESLCGLFYLFTLYAFVRGTEVPGSRPWLVASAAACLLGMGTKEVMVSAPLLVLLCDRAFVAGSFAAAWRARRGYYLALASTWLVLGLLVFTNLKRGGSAGFGTEIGAWTYVLTQCRAVVLYLKLVFWPAGQVFDYGTPVAATLADVWWQAALLLILLTTVVWSLARKPALGTLGAGFFLILAPSSSIVPVATQTIAEHRMYLPLAAVLVLVCVAARSALGALTRSAWISGALAAGVILALGGTTFARNRIYRSELALWQDTAAKRPDNPRAQHNLGLALTQAGRSDEAMAAFRRTIALQPNHAFARFELAKADLLAGRWNEAAAGFAAVVATDPRFVDAHVNLARALARLGRPGEAILHYQRALADEPGATDIRVELSRLLAQAGRVAEAEGLLREALSLGAGTAEAWFSLGNLLARQQRFAEAGDAYAAALTREPAHHEARANLANCQLFTGRIAEAIANYEAVLQARPGDTRTRENLRLAREAMRGR